jgi:hypothetical protein
MGYLSYARWHEYRGSPVLPDKQHWEGTWTIFDLVLLQENMTVTGQPADLYYLQEGAKPVETAMTWRMWNSWRGKGAIGYSTSIDGYKWNQTVAISLYGTGDTWESGINRPYVHKVATGKYAMWYTGQGSHGGTIGYAESTDGIEFTRLNGKSLTKPLKATQCRTSSGFV